VDGTVDALSTRLRNISFNSVRHCCHGCSDIIRNVSGNLTADKESATKRAGHGNAIAQAYGHAILPRSYEHDRLTQVVWGLADFRYRFGREANRFGSRKLLATNQTWGLLLIGECFVILAPDQAGRVVRQKGAWARAGIGQYRHHSPIGISTATGRVARVAIFFYHGPLGPAIAFERALSSSEVLVEIVQVPRTGSAGNVATDGEILRPPFQVRRSMFGPLRWKSKPGRLACALQLRAIPR